MKIITEIASGHNGDLELAKALIKSAAENGADIVKFQDWRASNVPDSDSDKQRYEKYQFSDEWYPILIPFCKENNVEFLTTCFNKDRVKFLAGLGLKKIKLASISLTNTELLMEAGANFPELIISTGMHSLEEVEEVVELLVSNAQKFSILHCVAEYPTDVSNANLGRINALKRIIEPYEQASCGFSDHSLDLDPAKAAMAMGISYLEKHFTLSRYLPQIPHTMFEGGQPLTTHSISIEPRELRELADWRDKVELMKQEKVSETEQKIKNRYAGRYGK